jgi:hypothetical protein
LSNFDRVNRDDRHAQFSDSLEQPVQRGLVGYRAGQQGITAFFQEDRQAFEPVCPAWIEGALDADLVEDGRIDIRGYVRFLRLEELPGMNGSTVYPSA